MRYETPAEAKRTLKSMGIEISAATIRRRARAGQIPHLVIGGHVVVDVDVLLPMLQDEIDRRDWVSSRKIAEMTGLTISVIRRGVKEGWLPAQRQGRHLP
ncbi:MAG: hypothetical protein ACOX7B_11830 [Christensenellales bacterium]|jgi:hypothetical protein